MGWPRNVYLPRLRGTQTGQVLGAGASESRVGVGGGGAGDGAAHGAKSEALWLPQGLHWTLLLAKVDVVVLAKLLPSQGLV